MADQRQLLLELDAIEEASETSSIGGSVRSARSSASGGGGGGVDQIYQPTPFLGTNNPGFKGTQRGKKMYPVKKPIIKYTDSSGNVAVPKGKSNASSNGAGVKFKQSDRKARPPSNSDDNDDLSQLTDLKVDVILQTLQHRYEKRIIHTNISDVLVIINPYEDLGIYGDEVHSRYMRVDGIADQKPHVFWTAQKAYHTMVDSHTNQCIIVSGESGAGKTVNTKHIIRHITEISAHDGESGILHERMVKVNPLLEAFGNAKTVMNDNSSRFGKYIEMFFNKSGQIIGANINSYMLEKSRVVHPGKQESNYHIFYYLFAGLPEDRRRYFYLEQPEDYRILAQGKSSVFESDKHRAYCKEQFDEVCSLLKTLGFTEDEDLEIIYQCLAAVLFIGDIEFEEDDDSGGCFIKDEKRAEIVAELLMLDKDEFVNFLTLTSNAVAGEDVLSLFNIDQACDNRDTLAKSLYSRLFGWIVRQVNQSIHVVDQSQLQSSSNSVGILDLAGFEKFEENSFEQLCINAANEKLHFYFNEHIFVKEQGQYEQEGISWEHIPFENNQIIIDLFLKTPNCLFSVLGDQSKFPAATDQQFVQKCNENFGKHDKYIILEGEPLEFGIVHFASEVVYNCTGFLEKNRDKLSNNMTKCVRASTNDFIGDLFKADLDETGSVAKTQSVIRRSTVRGPSMMQGGGFKGRGTSRLSKNDLKQIAKKQRQKRPKKDNPLQNLTTVSQHFVKSLDQLMWHMRKAEPLFVRCIKPNESKRPGELDDILVERQLRYNGVLEIAKIRQLGYPVRIKFEEFTRKFGILLSKRPQQQDKMKLCQDILVGAEYFSNGYALGKTRVFMKEETVLKLQKEANTRSAITIQKCVKSWLQQRKYAILKEEERIRKKKKVPTATLR